MKIFFKKVSKFLPQNLDQNYDWGTLLDTPLLTLYTESFKISATRPPGKRQVKPNFEYLNALAGGEDESDEEFHGKFELKIFNCLF